MCRTSLTMKSKPMSTAKMQKPTSSKYSHGHKAYERCEYAKGPAFALVQFNAVGIQDTNYLRENIYTLAQLNAAGIPLHRHLLAKQDTGICRNPDYAKSHFLEMAFFTAFIICSESSP